jgi:plasmid stabilization system protein ParE
MIVRYAPRAEADLIAIATYLGERSPGGAERVGVSIRRTIAVIA